MLSFYLLSLCALLIAFIYYRLVLAVKLFGKSLTGRNVLVTGAGNGIGKALCLALAREGCNVICVDIETESNNKTKQTVLEITNNKVKAQAFTCDLTKYENVQQLAQNVYKQFGHVDILINNAGIAMVGKFLDFTESGLKKVVDVNLMSQFWTVKSFLPGMIKRNTGHIVATASLAGKTPVASMAAYRAAKCAVIGFMDTINIEVQKFHKNANIKISTAVPFLVDTRLMKPGYLKKNSIYGLQYISAEKAASDYIDGIKLELSWFTIPRSSWFFFPVYSCMPSFITNIFSDYATTQMTTGANYKAQ